MRIILTGGTGQLGRALAADLISDGHEVIALSRTPERAISHMPEGVRLERWDAKTAEAWGPLVDGAGAIVNLAGEPLPGRRFFPTRWTPQRRKLIVESRQDAGRAVVEAIEAASHKPGVVVQASAIGYYGPNPAGEQTEDSPPGRDFLARVCIDWEASTAPVEGMGIRRVILRTGLVFNSKEGALPRLLLSFRLFAGGPMGSGQQWYSWIHQEDWVSAARFLIDDQSAAGIYNLTAPNPLKSAQLARLIGEVMRRPSFVPVPGFALRLAFGEVSTTVLDGQKVVPNRLLDQGYSFKYPEAEAALRDLLAVQD